MNRFFYVLQAMSIQIGKFNETSGFHLIGFLGNVFFAAFCTCANINIKILCARDRHRERYYIVLSYVYYLLLLYFLTASKDLNLQYD